MHLFGYWVLVSIIMNIIIIMIILVILDLKFQVLFSSAHFPNPISTIKTHRKHQNIKRISN